MLHVKERTVSIMVLYCVILHIFWAVLVALDPSAIGATPVHALYRIIGDTNLLSVALAAVAVMAVIGIYMRAPIVVWFLMPQQFLLLMSASGAISAIWIAQFADGVVRPRAFIAADQIHIVFAAVGHTIAVIAHARNRDLP